MRGEIVGEIMGEIMGGVVGDMTGIPIMDAVLTLVFGLTILCGIPLFLCMAAFQIAEAIDDLRGNR